MTPKTLTAGWVRSVIPRRPAASHKGNNGHVLLVAGSRGMAGAAILSGLGALRVGAGLLTLAIVEKERTIVAKRLPEAMTIPLPQTRDGALAAGAASVLARFLEKRRIDVLAMGPGLSQRRSVKHVVKSLIKRWQGPLVLDADGMNVLQPKDLKTVAHVIITPHPGELAHFLGISRPAIERNRIAVAGQTARRLGVICVLKGHQTVVSNGRAIYLNPTGNSAMATGGMGDVLTGIIAGLLAQGLAPLEAACCGVFLHGLAGDLARVSDRGLLATDLAARIPFALKKIGVR